MNLSHLKNDNFYKVAKQGGKKYHVVQWGRQFTHHFVAYMFVMSSKLLTQSRSWFSYM